MSPWFSLAAVRSRLSNPRVDTTTYKHLLVYDWTTRIGKLSCGRTSICRKRRLFATIVFHRITDRSKPKQILIFDLTSLSTVSWKSLLEYKPIELQVNYCFLFSLICYKLQTEHTEGVRKLNFVLSLTDAILEVISARGTPFTVLTDSVAIRQVRTLFGCNLCSKCMFFCMTQLHTASRKWRTCEQRKFLLAFYRRDKDLGHIWVNNFAITSKGFISLFSLPRRIEDSVVILSVFLACRMKASSQIRLDLKATS